MKKTYLNPAIEVIDLKVAASMLTTSGLSKGENWTSGDAAGRGNDGDDW